MPAGWVTGAESCGSREKEKGSDSRNVEKRDESGPDSDAEEEHLWLGVCRSEGRLLASQLLQIRGGDSLSYVLLCRCADPGTLTWGLHL